MNFFAAYPGVRTEMQAIRPDRVFDCGAAVIPFVNVSSGLLEQDMESVKELYSESTVQHFFYDGLPPVYANMLSGLIAFLKPSSVLEFGC